MKTLIVRMRADHFDDVPDLTNRMTAISGSAVHVNTQRRSNGLQVITLSAGCTDGRLHDVLLEPLAYTADRKLESFDFHIKDGDSVGNGSGRNG